MPATEGLGADIEQASEVDALRAALARTQRELAKAKSKKDEYGLRVVEAAVEAVLAHFQYKPVPKPVKDARRRKGEHALMHTTDWQGAKRTTSYDLAVMKARVLLFATKVARLVEIHRASGPVRDGTLLLGGDIIEGLFNFPSQAHEIEATLFEQMVVCADLLVELVRRLLAIFDHLTVVPEWGNHGRLGSKRDGVPRHDNADRMTYEFARRTLAPERDAGRLVWDDCPEDIQRIQIGEYRAILLHGDEVGRNGFASPSTIVSHVTRWQTGVRPFQDFPFRDAYIGHYHSHAEWPLPNGLGSVYQTGSTESDNRYAGVMLAASSTPSQRLHLIDPDRGRVTASYKVWLDS